MTKDSVSLGVLIDVRTRLIDDIKSRLDDVAQTFLLSLQDATPDFDIIGLPKAADLPAVKWKLLNLQKLIAENPAKHAEQKEKLLTIWTP